MKIFDLNMMNKLSFPDFEVEEMKIDFENKSIKIFVDGGYLDTITGIRLGRGFVSIDDWNSLVIVRFDSFSESCEKLEEKEIEPLKDLCEACFSDSLVMLAGFGKKSGDWTEWKILCPQVHAEFKDFY